MLNHDTVASEASLDILYDKGSPDWRAIKNDARIVIFKPEKILILLEKMAIGLRMLPQYVTNGESIRYSYP